MLYSLHSSWKLQYKDFRVFKYQSEDSADYLKTDESNGDYEGTAAWKPHSDSSDKKRTPEFVGEIQAMIDSDFNQSIRSIIRDMEVYEFLIRQVVLLRLKRVNFYHRS